ncbi:group III truncated hemoglobin [Rubellicoccus peritrichatus]|uniref:Group III truncated hemoglobin n=1 Tax=Rubellicoccus peritrichatus TaxID=3080537 RepID=A0AAQ3L7L4_9BACT|nr:group III truncated hemoglobin [Puniceicoccus sp. CR14]WOO40137.1 group III truncated hemoglobin [Puniceicoccus sp. CR14]
MEKVTSLYDRIGQRSGLIKLLNHFYADVRQHKVIGPIFESKVDNWPPHIEKIADFWSGLTGGPRNYSGGMPWKHMSLGIGPEHFEAWLGLWQRNCINQLDEPEASELVQIALQIAVRLKTILAQHDQPI